MARRSPVTAAQFTQAVRAAAFTAGFAAMVVPVTPVNAQVYRCHSESGATEYTNTPRARCARLDPAPLSSVPVPARSATVRIGGGAGAPSANGGDAGAAASTSRGGQGTGADGPPGSASAQGAVGTVGTVGTVGRSPAMSAAAVHARIDAATQRARDSDRRRILEDELGREAARLDDLRREVASVESARRSGERDDPKVRDRHARLRDDLVRSEGNVSALRRELASLRD